MFVGGLVSFTLFRIKKVKSSGKWLSLFGKTKSLFFGRAIKCFPFFGVQSEQLLAQNVVYHLEAEIRNVLLGESERQVLA